MVMQALLGTASFSLGILAFCSGVWLTVWHLNHSHPKEVRASMIAGYFIVILSIVSLSITSYKMVQSVMYPDPMPGMMWGPKNFEKMQHGGGNHSHMHSDMKDSHKNKE